MPAHWHSPRWSRPISGLSWLTARSALPYSPRSRGQNPALWWVAAATAAILAGVILFPPARELFHFGPLHGHDITLALAAGLISLLLLELAKRLMEPFFSVRHPPTETANRWTNRRPTGTRS